MDHRAPPRTHDDRVADLLQHLRLGPQAAQRPAVVASVGTQHLDHHGGQQVCVAGEIGLVAITAPPAVR
jgi:hypothetical protein